MGLTMLVAHTSNAMLKRNSGFSQIKHLTFFPSHTLTRAAAHRKNTMYIRFVVFALVLALAFGSLIIAPRSAEAHQPFCEFTDIDFDTAWQVNDPSVSVAY